MAALNWFAEPFQSYGAFAGEGARRVLGKPRLDPLSVLVRETVQNSWDAKRPDRSTIEFAMDGWMLTDEQLHTLRHDVFAELPPDGIALGAVLDREQVAALVVTDRGTVGLTGPVRADMPVTGRSDFVDLVFNMGQPRDVAGGGGTYGFGKTITYVVSEASTGLLYTRTRVEAELESRLIAVAVGNQYATDIRRFTGRHWWGVGGAASVEPLVGSDADELAMRLGFPSFDADSTGLSMMILAPRLDGRTPLQAMHFIANSLSWNFWPKMIGRHVGEDAPIEFRVSWQDTAIPVPHPDSHPPLGAFAKALRAVHAEQDEQEIPDGAAVISIGAQRPSRQLGLLGLVRTPRDARRTVDDGSDDEEELPSSALFPGNSHHVALMRQVELVVRYLEGPELPGGHVEWAGVFMNDADIDVAFADAEPPTHDDWIPEMVEEKSHRRLVNIALREIAAEVRGEFAPVGATPQGGDATSAVTIGNALGGLIAAVAGSATSKDPAGIGSAGGSTGTGGAGGGGAGAGGSGGSGSGGGGSGTAATSRALIADMAIRPAMVEGVAGVEVEFRVETRGLAARVSGSASAALDGTTAEREPPLGAPVPLVLGWRRMSETGMSVVGPWLAVDPGDDDTWVMVVANPAGTAVAVDIHAVDPGQA